MMCLFKIDKNSRNPRTTSIVPVFVLALFLAACATANTGGVRRSPEVAQAFETYQVNPDFNYYHYNQENNPYAVVGLLKDYFIKDPDWRPFDPNSDKYQKVIDLVKSFPDYYNFPYGSYIVDPQGSRIGMWYSTLPSPGISVNPETKKVSINAARPWLRDEDVWWRDGGGVGVGIGTGSGGGIRIGF